jgi:hypothetical protein
MNTIAFTIDALLLLTSLAWNVLDKKKGSKEHRGPYFTFKTRTDEQYEEPMATYPDKMDLPHNEDDIPLYGSSVLHLSGYQGPILRANDIQEHPYLVVSKYSS